MPQLDLILFFDQVFLILFSLLMLLCLMIHTVSKSLIKRFFIAHFTQHLLKSTRVFVMICVQVGAVSSFWLMTKTKKKK